MELWYCCYDIPMNSTNDTHRHCTWCNRHQSIKLILSELLKDRCRQHSRMQLEVGLVEVEVASDIIMHACMDRFCGRSDHIHRGRPSLITRKCTKVSLRH